jgi:hypothetical protein
MKLFLQITARCGASAACAMIVVLGGCNRGPVRDASVQGAVLIDGELAQSGSVVFTPEGGGNVSTGNISTDGSYSLRTGQGDVRKTEGGSLASGKYSVSVLIFGPSTETLGEGGPPKPGPSLIASKYSNNATSGLQFDVKPGRNVINLELEGVDSMPPEDPSLVELKEATEAAGAEPATEVPAETVPPTEADPSADSQSETPAESTPATERRASVGTPSTSAEDAAEEAAAS